MGRVKSVWGEDSEEFKPERWLEASRRPSTSGSLLGWNGLMAFSTGVRMCVGYRLAVLEFKVQFNPIGLILSFSLMFL